MTNNKRILDHTTATFSAELSADWAGELVPKFVTIEGIVFTLNENGYSNTDLKVNLYMEGSSEDFTDIWYTEIEPMEE